MKRGRFIVFYGINNIGKSTQSARFAARLKKNGVRVKHIKYPVYDLKPTGPLLNRILRGGNKQGMSEEELQLWYVLNRYQFQPKLVGLLEQGITIVAEDYIGTGLAWGMAKGAKQAGLERMNKFLVQPDVSILLYGKRFLRAKEAGHLHESDDALVARCARMFEKLAKRHKWLRVDVSGTKDEVEERIWEHFTD